MTYELINRRTGNTLGDFSDERGALSLYERMQDVNPQIASELIIVEFDDSGEAVASHTPAEYYV